MERLMLLKLQAQGCGAEAWINGIPVVRIAPGQAAATLAVHEYALSGPNRFALVLAPEAPPGVPGQPVAASMSASLHLLLPRLGAPVDEQQARSLAQVELAVAAGEAVALPSTKTLEVTLPINFPRWRWTEAPLCSVTPALVQQVLAFVAGLMQDLARGQTASFIAATRLRSEELALAYQRQPGEETARLESWLQGLHAAGKLRWPVLDPTSLHLRSVADGRLVECVAADGSPLLRTLPDENDRTIALPLRLAVADGRLHVLR